jgi:hypothetical protein
MEYIASIGGRQVHELGFYYAIDLPEDSPFLDLTHEHAGRERGHDLVLRWFAIDVLPDVPLVPDFLRTAMRELPDGPQHIVRMNTDADPASQGTTG